MAAARRGDNMADLLLHIKDGYFFEVPRFLRVTIGNR